MFCTKTSLARWIGWRSNECQDICRCLENPELVAGGFLQLFHLGWCWPRTRRCKDCDLQSIWIYIYMYISTICLRNISQVACARWVAATYRSWNYHVAPISHVGEWKDVFPTFQEPSWHVLATRHQRMCLGYVIPSDLLRLAYMQVIFS